MSEADEDAGADLALHGEIAYLFRERDRSPGRAPSDLTETELAALRERLVLEAAAKVLDAMRAPDPDARAQDTAEPAPGHP